MSAIDHYLDVEERENRNSGQGLRSWFRLLGLITDQRGTFAAGAGLILLGSAALLAQPWLLGRAVDIALRPGKGELLGQLALALFALNAIRVAALMAQTYLFEILGQRVMQRLRIQLFSHLQTLPVRTFDKNPVGRLVTRVTNDVSALSEMFSAGFISIIDNLLRVLGTVLLLIWLDWRFALVALAPFPLLVLLSIHFTGRLRVCYREARAKLSALNAFLAENILGMRVVQLFNREPLHLERFHQVNESYTSATIRTVRTYAYFQPSITWVSGVSMALVIGYGGVQVSEGRMTLGILVSFFALVQALFQPIREIADKWNIFLAGMASVERIFSILDWPREVDVPAVPERASGIASVKGHIRFEDVWFAYDEERWVLQGLNFEIQPGEKIGVVGHTGAGKTTLIQLLLRFHEPQRGRILLDGRDLRDYDKRSLRATIGLIQQDAFLFSGDAEENLGLGRVLDAESRARVEPALKKLGYPHWLGTAEQPALELLERGSNLSMGERQVLAFARAASIGPRLWILDEATANIDPETERALGQVLEASSGGFTSIFIAHRLATVREANRVFVLHRGKLAEEGTHEQLLQVNGLYARLWRFQEPVDSSEAKEFSPAPVHPPGA